MVFAVIFFLEEKHNLFSYTCYRYTYVNVLESRKVGNINTRLKIALFNNIYIIKIRCDRIFKIKILTSKSSTATHECIIFFLYLTY